MTLTAATIAAGVVAVAAEPAQATGSPTTYAGPTFPASVTAPSADKPQSKMWRADGAWWAVMADTTSGLPTIHELLSGHTWRNTGIAIDTRLNSTADVDLVGPKLYIASRTTTGDLLFTRYTYNSAGRTYGKDTGYPITIDAGGSESVSLARDSVGVTWATWTQGSRVLFARTTTSTNDLLWTAAANLPVADNTVAADDISGIVAFSGKIGVAYSDQQSGAFRFAVHTDGAATSAWTQETALAGADLTDDHLNLKAIANDSLGRVFIAVKTGKDMVGSPVSTDPLILVLRRSSTGVWTATTAGRVADQLTRPQLAIDSEHQRLYVFMTSPAAGGNIFFKSSPMATLAFPPGRGSVFIGSTGAVLNNVTTPKDPVSSATGLVAVASDDTNDRYYHAEASLAITADQVRPLAPASATAAVTSSSSVRFTWPTGSDDAGIKDYLVYRNNVLLGSSAILGYTDQFATPSTTYTYSVATRDLAGNISLKRAAGAVTTPSLGGPISVRSASKAVIGSGTSITVAKPTGVATGDVLVASITTRSIPGITGPTGWSRMLTTDGTTTIRQTIWYKVATGSEPSSYTWTLTAANAGAARIVAYQGASRTAPIRTLVGKSNAASTTITSGSLAARNGDVVVAMFGTARASAITPNSGLSEKVEAISSTGTYTVTGETADKQNTVNGTVGPFTATATAGASINLAQVVVLRRA
jgi:hypothetical protein